MKKMFLFFALVLFLGMSLNINAQVSLVMCERYDATYGPVNPGGIFTTGYLTVVAISSSKMYYDDVYIQYDKLGSDGQYHFYKLFPFTFPNGHSTVYFSRVGDNDMEFNNVGVYNVFLLNKYKETIAYTTVTIISR